MTNLIHTIYQEDGTFIQRPFTEEELLIWEQDEANRIAKLNAIAETQAKKAAAEAKLAALGLTAEDLRSLGL